MTAGVGATLLTVGAAGAAGAAAGQMEGNSAKQGYLVSRADTIARTSYGECVHTRAWTPDLAVVGCDGKEKQVTARTEAEPEPPRAAPEPAPQPPRERVVTLQTKTLFNFDKASLRAGAGQELDAVIRKLEAKEEVKRVYIEGHADHIGSSDYNQRLSERRAETVATYLRDSGRLRGTEFVVNGNGERDPAVSCPDTKGFNQLVACLQPNRRVEVEIDAVVREPGRAGAERPMGGIDAQARR